MFIRDGISVLLQETFSFISDIQSVVSNSECRVAETRFLENILVLGLAKLVVKFLQE